MKVAFYLHKSGTWESDCAVYDYAHNNETLLGHRSIIIIGQDDSGSRRTKFDARFKVFQVEDSLDDLLIREKCDVLYVLKPGQKDSIFSTKVFTSIHCFSVCSIEEKHGDTYFPVSPTINNTYSSIVPYVCTRIPINTDLRHSTGIPEDAYVFGRYGNSDGFDVPEAREAVLRVLESHPNVYFLFMNTPEFVEHNNVKYFSINYSDSFKAQFILSCDAMLHAEVKGEIFGLVISDFTSIGKTIITCKNCSVSNFHQSLIGKNAIYYETADELYKILTNFKHVTSTDYCSIFTPSNVMKAWEKSFLPVLNLL
jgi:hypothetical protein